MPETSLLILADDLTGALDSGVQFAKKGIVVRVYPSPEAAAEAAGENAGELAGTDIPCETVSVINTSTRRLKPEEAARVTAACAAAFNRCAYFYKKTDSCLRGNIGAELEALMKASGVKRLPFAPAYPALGRTTEGGVQYLDGKPVHETSMAQDPLNPVTESYIPAVIGKQSAIPVQVVPPGADPHQAQNEREILVFDCKTSGGLRAIAALLKDQDLIKAAAGCAGFAEALMEVLPLKAEHREEGTENALKGLPLLVVSGSVHPVSREQIRAALDSGIPGLAAEAEKLGRKGWGSSAEAAALAEECAGFLRDRGVCVLGTAAALEGGKEAACDGDAGTIAGELGKLAAATAGKCGPLVTAVFGGDTLSGVMEAYEYSRIVPEKELFPGVVLAEAAGPGGRGLIITKAGSFGTKDLVPRIAEYCKNHENRGDENHVRL
ncbi:MAG: four-carbon acid sugar kinase family protein [Treponema sp.]|nr:four-carbon acid sugar kinase family protein [Treponema sp.]